MNKLSILVIIPARGGSKGIPRKNLRKLGQFPLLYYSITNAKKSIYHPDIFVSSEDEEIQSMARLFGAGVVPRSSKLAEDSTTLDPVIYDGYLQAMELKNKDYDLIVTLQPTSPLLTTTSLDSAITRMIETPTLDTIISATDDTHLKWTKHNNEEFYTPLFKKRLNRQYLKPSFKETGGFLITRNNIISTSSRIGKNVELYLLERQESIDIDSFEDWALCEFYLDRKKILFNVIGNTQIGLGHAYNCLALANELTSYDITFFVETGNDLAFEVINRFHYKIITGDKSVLYQTINSIRPELIINDVLDTSKDLINKQRASINKKLKILNIEDLGEGSTQADLVINAMYPEKEQYPNHYYGHKYFCLKDDFLYSQRLSKSEDNVKQILITYGGVDPNNYTRLTLDSIYNYCQDQNIHIKVILGLGYQNHDKLKRFKNIELHSNVKNMAEQMAQADIIFTSAGRTTFEICSIGVPSIVLTQNKREQTHFFAYPKYGFINLGMVKATENELILEEFKSLVENPVRRTEMAIKMKSTDLINSKKRVIDLIKKTI